MIAILNYFPSLLPESVNSDLLLSIFTFMIIGYGIYSLIHYPVSAYLFKYAPTKNQEIISRAVLVISILFFVFYYSLMTDWLQSHFINLIGAVLLFIFTVEIIKSYILFFKKQNHAVS